MAEIIISKTKKGRVYNYPTPEGRKKTRNYEQASYYSLSLQLPIVLDNCNIIEAIDFYEKELISVIEQDIKLQLKKDIKNLRLKLQENISKMQELEVEIIQYV